jgi:D-alanyl-D-alanine carboxypeptidase (penicillin-binding protein 5/6)
MKCKCRLLLSLVLSVCIATSTICMSESNLENTSEDTDVSIATLEADQETSEIANENPVSSEPRFELDAKAAILIEAETGTVLYKFNENEPLPIASITKIMTMLLVMEAMDSGKIKTSDKTTISAYATSMGGSQVYLKEGEVFTIEELLKAVAVHSANDASVALAEVIAGSEEAFVAMMNEKARELKMKNTKFLDCTGLTDDGHYSTAADIAVMSRELIIKHPKIVHYTTIWHDTFRDGKFDLDNTNKLVKRYRGTTGIKTGFTRKSGFCLAASAERDGCKFISVILGSESNEKRFSESARLLDYGFSNFETSKLEKKGLTAGAVKVKKGIHSEIPVNYSDNAVVVIKKGSKDKITETLEIPEIINAPVKEGQSVGVLNVDLEGRRIASIPIVAAQDSPKCTFGLLFGMISGKWAKIFIG